MLGLLPEFHRYLPGWLAPVPLALVQPVLNRIARHVARSRPTLFSRLGPHEKKRFLIDPVDLPFVLVLVPDAERPHLQAHYRSPAPPYDAKIAGTFFNLLDTIGGSLDGDALFFNRGLQVSGDVEAVVSLRNALDDSEVSMLDSVLAAFGPLSKPAALALSALQAVQSSNR